MRQLTISQAAHLLDLYSLEDLLGIGGITPEEAVVYLVNEDIITLPEVMPTDDFLEQDASSET